MKQGQLPFTTLKEFIKLESAGGIILFVSAVLAMIIANSPWGHYYDNFFDLPLSFHFGQLGLSKPFILWINDGFMAIFFMMVTLEIKREMLVGELNSLKKVALPGIAALGGILLPAAIYLCFNHNDRTTHDGWAIPTATDIAFALGLLSLLGKRVPIQLKVFLTAIAIFDDIAAITIIAIFYTAKISLLSLTLALPCLLILVSLNRAKVTHYAPYMLTGILLWVFVLKSGVHATLTGVVIATAIPIAGKDENTSPLKQLEHTLHPWVVFLILPLFGFANAGVTLKSLTPEMLYGGLFLGVTLGLFIGKQLGIFTATFLAVKLKIAHLPKEVTWLQVYGASLICGIGFTMSLFIGTLAFSDVGTTHEALVRIGVLAGSILSGTFGYFILHYASKNKKANA